VKIQGHSCSSNPIVTILLEPKLAEFAVMCHRVAMKHTVFIGLVLAGLSGAAKAEPQVAPPAVEAAALVPRICELIANEADKNGIPKEFFARLIWKESRFDVRAVSPVGAEGIAQFMPATAKFRGLKDSFDLEQALPASAAYLAELTRVHGNLGLAAAAYNAGEGRLGQWMNGGFLPIETENYVFDVLGEPAEVFLSRDHKTKIKPLDDKLSFSEACLKLPVILSRSVSMAQTLRKPWFIQVAGGFKQGPVAKKWARLKPKLSGIIGNNPVALSRSRSPLGRRGIYTVRIGADSRNEADNICGAITRSGSACVVKKVR
jgi:Transglycosylase SLT domain/SPOR domain